MGKTNFTKHLIVPLALLAMSCTLANKEDNLSQLKIRGGEETSKDPAVVALYLGNSMQIDMTPPEFVCTGTLITPNTVLTAAHCVVFESDIPSRGPFYVYTGSDLRDPAKRSKPILVKEIHVDNSYSDSERLGTDRESHDIALLVLAEPLAIQPIPYLKKPLTQDMLTKQVRIVGFGVNGGILIQKGSEVKRTAAVKIKNLTDNDYLGLGGIFYNICSGDSGGPVLMEIDGVETVIGVNSFGGLGCLPTSFATRVDKYLDKIITPVVEASIRQQSSVHVIQDMTCKAPLKAKCFATNKLIRGFGASASIEIDSCAGAQDLYFHFDNMSACEKFTANFDGLTLPTGKTVETLNGGQTIKSTALWKYLKPEIKEGAFIRSALYNSKLCELKFTNNYNRDKSDGDLLVGAIDLPIPACEEIRNLINGLKL